MFVTVNVYRFSWFLCIRQSFQNFPDTLCIPIYQGCLPTMTLTAWVTWECYWNSTLLMLPLNFDFGISDCEIVLSVCSYGYWNLTRKFKWKRFQFKTWVVYKYYERSDDWYYKRPLTQLKLVVSEKVMTLFFKWHFTQHWFQYITCHCTSNQDGHAFREVLSLIPDSCCSVWTYYLHVFIVFAHQIE